jgi:integrase
MTRPAKKSRPRGSLKKQKDGRFVARYSLGMDPLTGKRLQRWRTFDDRKEAQQWLTAELAALDAGARHRRVSGGPTLAAYLRDFYTNDRRTKDGSFLSPRTCAVDLEMVERYLIRRAPAIAETPLGKLTTDQLARWTRALSLGDDAHQALAKGTVARMKRIVSARLGHAVALGLLRTNPADSPLVAVSGKKKKEQIILNAEQARALLDVCPSDRYGALFALIVWTGLRPGEAAGLTWPDVHLERSVVIVRRALVRMSGSVELRDTKTEKARAVAIPGELVAMLRAHRARQAEEKLSAGTLYHDTGLVFCTRYGLPTNHDNLARRHFKPLLLSAAYHLAGRTPPPLPAPSRSAAYAEAVAARQQADAAVMKDTGFPDVSLYGLRHTQATLMLESGVDTKIVSERLGHSRTSTTNDIYQHVTKHMQDDALKKLEGALGSARAAG